MAHALRDYELPYGDVSTPAERVLFSSLKYSVPKFRIQKFLNPGVAPWVSKVSN